MSSASPIYKEFPTLSSLHFKISEVSNFVVSISLHLGSPFPYPPSFFNLIELDFSLHFFTGTFLLLEKMGTFQCFFRLPSWKPLALWSNLLFLKCSFIEFYEIALFISSREFCLVPQTMLGPLLYASGRGFNVEVLAESLKIYQSEVPSQDGNF